MAKKKRFAAPKPVDAAEPAAPQPAPKPAVSAVPRLMSSRDWKALGLVVAVALAAYLNSLDGHFLYDDRYQILKNPTLADLGNIPRMFTQSVWQFMNASSEEAVGSYYRPLFNAVLILNYHLFGLDPGGWHAVSVLLHLGVTAGVFAVARQWALSTETSAAAALLFGLHPTHVESVAWASGVPDPLAGVLLVGALLAYERARGRRAPGLVAASLALAFLATLTKETAVVFPAFVGMRELLDGEEGEAAATRLARAVRRALPYGAVALAYLAMRYAVLGFLTKTEPKAVGIPGAWVPLTIPSVLAHYARLLVLPYPLAITYDVTYVTSPADPRFWGDLAVVAALLAAVAWLVHASPVARRALCWLALFLLPVLNFKAFNQDESLVHDRYLYLPSIGFCLLAAMGLEAAAARFGERRRQVFTYATAAACVLFFAFTVFQNETWSDDFAMAGQAIKHDPNRPFLYNYLGAMYGETGKMADAEAQYRRALELRPDYFDALTNLGDVYRAQNRFPEAEEAYRKAVDAGAPYYNTYYNLANVYIATKRYPEAAAALARAAEVDPASSEARFSLGWVYDQMGDAANAERYYADALRLKPGYPEPRINLGVLETKQGRYKEALDNLAYAQKIAPQHPVMLYALGDLYMKTGRYQDAVTVLTQIQPSPNGPSPALVHTSLGLCYESLGQVAQARASFQRAVQADPNANVAREHLARLGA
jgi:tetratricopeptide (TPR) repeat protein